MKNLEPPKKYICATAESRAENKLLVAVYEWDNAFNIQYRISKDLWGLMTEENAGSVNCIDNTTRYLFERYIDRVEADIKDAAKEYAKAIWDREGYEVKLVPKNEGGNKND